eukprot:UN27163
MYGLICQLVDSLENNIWKNAYKNHREICGNKLFWNTEGNKQFLLSLKLFIKYSEKIHGMTGVAAVEQAMEIKDITDQNRREQRGRDNQRGRSNQRRVQRNAGNNGVRRTHKIQQPQGRTGSPKGQGF